MYIPFQLQCARRATFLSRVLSTDRELKSLAFSQKKKTTKYCWYHRISRKIYSFLKYNQSFLNVIIFHIIIQLFNPIRTLLYSSSFLKQVLPFARCTLYEYVSTIAVEYFSAIYHISKLLSIYLLAIKLSHIHRLYIHIYIISYDIYINIYDSIGNKFNPKKFFYIIQYFLMTYHILIFNVTEAS